MTDQADRHPGGPDSLFRHTRRASGTDGWHEPGARRSLPAPRPSTTGPERAPDAGCSRPPAPPPCRSAADADRAGAPARRCRRARMPASAAHRRGSTVMRSRANYSVAERAAVLARIGARRSARRAASRCGSPARRRAARAPPPHHGRAPSRPADRRGRDAALDHRLFADEERARRVDRRLHVHAVVDHVGDELDVPHRLVVRAHDAERHVACGRRGTASAGMMVCIGRLPGPNVLGCAGSTTKQAPRLVSMMPVFSVQMPTPKYENSVLISDTALRSRSTTVR